MASGKSYHSGFRPMSPDLRPSLVSSYSSSSRESLVATEIEMGVIERPPPAVEQKLELKSFWYISSKVRDMLKIPKWQEKMEDGFFPSICMYNDFCRVFEERNQLESHWMKKPDHQVDVHGLIQRSRLIQEKQRSSRSPLPQQQHRASSATSSRTSEDRDSLRRRTSEDRDSLRRRSSDRSSRDSYDAPHRPQQSFRPNRRSPPPFHRRTDSSRYSRSPVRTRSPPLPPPRRSPVRERTNIRHGRRRTPLDRDSNSDSDEEQTFYCSHCKVLLNGRKEYSRHLQFYNQSGRCQSQEKQIKCGPEGLKRHQENPKENCRAYEGPFRPPSPKGPHPDDIAARHNKESQLPASNRVEPDKAATVVLQEPHVTSTRLRSSPIQQSSPVSPPIPQPFHSFNQPQQQPPPWPPQMNFSHPPPPAMPPFHSAGYSLPTPVPTHLNPQPGLAFSSPSNVSQPPHGYAVHEGMQQQQQQPLAPVHSLRGGQVTPRMFVPFVPPRGVPPQHVISPGQCGVSRPAYPMQRGFAGAAIHSAQNIPLSQASPMGRMMPRAQVPSQGISVVPQSLPGSFPQTAKHSNQPPTTTTPVSRTSPTSSSLSATVSSVLAAGPSPVPSPLPFTARSTTPQHFPRATAMTKPSLQGLEKPSLAQPGSAGEPRQIVTKQKSDLVLTSNPTVTEPSVSRSILNKLTMTLPSLVMPPIGSQNAFLPSKHFESLWVASPAQEEKIPRDPRQRRPGLASATAAALLSCPPVPGVRLEDALAATAAAKVRPPQRDPRLERRTSVESTVAGKTVASAVSPTISSSLLFEKRNVDLAVGTSGIGSKRQATPLLDRRLSDPGVAIPSGILSKPSQSLPSVQNLFGTSDKALTYAGGKTVVATKTGGVKRPSIDDAILGGTAGFGRSRSTVISSWKRSKKDQAEGDERGSPPADKIATQGDTSSMVKSGASPPSGSPCDSQKQQPVNISPSKGTPAKVASISPGRSISANMPAAAKSSSAKKRKSEEVVKISSSSIVGGNFEAALANADLTVKKGKKEVTRKRKHDEKPEKANSEKVKTGTHSRDKKSMETAKKSQETHSRSKKSPLPTPTKDHPAKEKNIPVPAVPLPKEREKAKGASVAVAQPKKPMARRVSKSKESWKVGESFGSSPQSVDTNSAGSSVGNQEKEKEAESPAPKLRSKLNDKSKLEVSKVDTTKSNVAGTDIKKQDAENLGPSTSASLATGGPADSTLVDDVASFAVVSSEVQHVELQKAPISDTESAEVSSSKRDLPEGKAASEDVDQDTEEQSEKKDKIGENISSMENNDGVTSLNKASPKEGSEERAHISSFKESIVNDPTAQEENKELQTISDGKCAAVSSSTDCSIRDTGESQSASDVVLDVAPVAPQEVPSEAVETEKDNSKGLAFMESRNDKSLDEAFAATNVEENSPTVSAANDAERKDNVSNEDLGAEPAGKSSPAKCSANLGNVDVPNHLPNDDSREEAVTAPRDDADVVKDTGEPSQVNAEDDDSSRFSDGEQQLSIFDPQIVDNDSEMGSESFVASADSIYSEEFVDGGVVGDGSSCDAETDICGLDNGNETSESIVEEDPLEDLPGATTFTATTLCVALGGGPGKGGEESDDDRESNQDDATTTYRPLVLVHGDGKSIDFCPGCKTKLDPVQGHYSLNCVTFEVTVTCISCRKNVLIKEAFSERDKTALLHS